MPIIDPLKRGSQQPLLAPHELVRFRQRTAVERVSSRLKDQFGRRFITVRGNPKVMAHLMFGLLALTVDQLLRLLPEMPAPLPVLPSSDNFPHPRSEAVFARALPMWAAPPHMPFSHLKKTDPLPLPNYILEVVAGFTPEFCKSLF